MRPICSLGKNNREITTEGVVLMGVPIGKSELMISLIRDNLESKVDKVLVFFNNHFQAKAVEGAKALAGLLTS